ncbi:MAG: GGDEF domain-containing protein [Candidatus Woesearchaeota archaeon]
MVTGNSPLDHVSPEDARYLLHGFYQLTTDMAGVRSDQGLEDITKAIVEVCGRQFRCSRVDYVPLEKVRTIFEKDEEIKKAVKEKDYLQRGTTIYIPLSNNGFRNLGVLYLEGVTTDFCGQAEDQRDPILKYLGGHAGQIVALAMQRDFDELTRLLRKNSFNQMYQRIVEEARQSGSILSLLMLDIDHFKWYNDNFGHTQGDEALRTVGKVIRKSIRDSDIPSRYGGEEFVVALPNTGCSGALKVGEKIRQAMEETRVDTSKVKLMGDGPAYHLETPRRINCSIGVACCPLHTPDHFDLMSLADTALYDVKKGSRNAVKMYEPEMERPPQKH